MSGVLRLSRLNERTHLRLYARLHSCIGAANSIFQDHKKKMFMRTEIAIFNSSEI